jgi:hypothetical protein
MSRYETIASGTGVVHKRDKAKEPRNLFAYAVREGEGHAT